MFQANLKMVGAAVAGGFIEAISANIVDHADFNLGNGLRRLILLFLVGVVIVILTWLIKPRNGTLKTGVSKQDPQSK
jgi:hypothetical protein